MRSIAAKIEGREPPTALPESPVDSDNENEYDFFFVIPYREVEEEDPIQREIRLRAEAKERLNKKFGPGGLAKQAVGSSPIPPGGYGQQTQSEDEYNSRIGIRSSLSKMLSSFTSSVKKTFQDAKISESIQSGVNSVKTKLNDPNLQNEVKEKAQAGWSWLSSTAGSLWSAAKEAASSIANEMSDQPGGNASRPVPPPPAATTPRSSEAGSSPAGATGATATTADATAAPEEEVNDEDWMEAELKKAK